jgi:hypothetical protein
VHKLLMSAEIMRSAAIHIHISFLSQLFSITFFLSHGGEFDEKCIIQVDFLMRAERLHTPICMIYNNNAAALIYFESHCDLNEREQRKRVSDG